jgi:hypothetical protein
MMDNRASHEVNNSTVLYGEYQKGLRGESKNINLSIFNIFIRRKTGENSNIKKLLSMTRSCVGLLSVRCSPKQPSLMTFLVTRRGIGNTLPRQVQRHSQMGLTSAYNHIQHSLWTEQ